MAKRRRLELPSETVSPDLETKSAFPRARMPIAEVAIDTAGRAALEEVASALTSAETEGRLIRRLPISKIVIHHLIRDRLVLDEGEMDALKASIAERGQQSAIEVVVLPNGEFGLISGLRRVEALRALQADTVLALVRQPDGSQQAYQAMVEENEIRSGLSFYERAHICIAAVEQGVYPSAKLAAAGLFAHAAPAKRSKILRFVTICEKLGGSLRFPAAIPEKLGLALAQALEADGALAGRISEALRKTPPGDAAGERRTLERALKKQSGSATGDREELTRGLIWQGRAGRVVLSGPVIDDAFLEAMREFAISHAKKTG